MPFIEESDAFFGVFLSGTESPERYKRQLINHSSNFDTEQIQVLPGQYLDSASTKQLPTSTSD